METAAHPQPALHSLANHLLIAMPYLDDPYFSGSVALICHHTQGGAMGLVINRASDFLFGEVLRQMGIAPTDIGPATYPVLDGGPVSPERGFVLHSPDGGPWDSTFEVSGSIHLTTSRDILDALAHGTGPQHAILALGYAGWSEQQLERELAQNTWLSVPAQPDILFKIPPAERWHAATRLIGFEPSALAGYSGHA